ncbi:hypothetical protein ACJMK2_010941 [Sinanodonta woodiana]|uniref:VWFA domain-containing protein n=2 Tax=Sinanodonta woodiana TaxID=1069815 RepID=A0ABD3V6C3_SINWO
MFIIAVIVSIFGLCRGSDLCGSNPAEIFFALDSSGSISLFNFQKELEFAKDVTSMFEIADDKTRVGLVTFSDTVYPQFNLRGSGSKSDILDAIRNTKYNGGGTNTAEALAYLREKGLSRSKTREGIPRIAIVITDGQSQNMTATFIEAAKVHDDGIIAFVVGIGAQVDMSELSVIATKPTKKFLFTIDDFDALPSIRELLAVEACKVEPATPKPEILSDEEVAEQELRLYNKCSPKRSMDIAFAVDSAGMGVSNTKIITRSISNLTDHLDLSNGRISIATVSSGCSAGSFSDEWSSDPNVIKKNLVDFQVPRFSEIMRDMRLRLGNGRSDASRIGIIFMYEQLSNAEMQKSFLEMRRAKFQKISIFVIGIGKHVDSKQAKGLVTEMGQFLEVSGFDNLNDIEEQLLLQLCTF